MSNTLLEVPDRIYNNRNIDKTSYYAKCIKGDLISHLHQILVSAGYYLNHEGVYKRAFTALGVNTPWHHVKHLRSKKCGIDHRVKFDGLGIIPPRCLECWKVVVFPKTLKQLFQLLDVQKALGRASKCGIDLRYYSPNLYDGFFYNNSLEEGRECYEVVRNAINEHLGIDVKVILKRGCTEYEMIKGPSVAWTLTREEREVDKRIDEIVDLTTPNVSGQSEEALAQVHSHWIEWAWKFSDPTVAEYIGELPLYPPAVTYHEGDISDIKADIMRARAKVKYDIDGEVTDAVHMALQGFEMTKKVGLDKVGAIIGYEDFNPLFVGETDD